MKVKYFQDTDTLYIEFKAAEVAESKDLDENTVLDVDRDGNICGLTIEHASQRADIPRFSYEQVASCESRAACEEFWLKASEPSLDAIWDNCEDDVYAELLLPPGEAMSTFEELRR